MDLGQLTSAKAAPYLIILSVDFSIDPLISGVYSLSNPSSSWSDERSASAYAEMISWRGWAVAKVRTVSFAENRNLKDPLCFPMTIVSVFLYQRKFADWLVMSDSGW